MGAGALHLLGRASLGAGPGSPGVQGVCPEGRAERALAVAGVLGQALLPGREDAPRWFASSRIFEGGPGVRGQRPPGLLLAAWLAGRRRDGWFLPAPVGLAVEDEFVGGGLEPVDGRLGEQGSAIRASHSTGTGTC
jgi:hypothetical protein